MAKRRSLLLGKAVPWAPECIGGEVRKMVDALTIVGGGETDVAVHQAGESDKISFISTGGGASLALPEGKLLSAVAALERCGDERSLPPPSAPAES